MSDDRFTGADADDIPFGEGVTFPRPLTEEQERLLKKADARKAEAKRRPRPQPVPDTPHAQEPEVEFVASPVTDFASVEAPGAEALVATVDGSSLFPANGFGLVYGAEGTSKTTLVIDWLVHFAQGKDWHGLLHPGRPLRSLLVENEGPRPEFRKKLARRLAALPDGANLGEFIYVLEKPWAEVDLRTDAHREALARLIAELDIDLVVIGPLFAIGMEGPGSADDINDFEAFLKDLRKRSGRSVFVLVVHHENKARDVSGAWGPRPDLLIHLQAQEPQHVRVHWRKTKWASQLHGQSTYLKWAEGDVRSHPASGTGDRAGGVGGHRGIRARSRGHGLGSGGQGCSG